MCGHLLDGISTRSRVKDESMGKEEDVCVHVDDGFGNGGAIGY